MDWLLNIIYLCMITFSLPCFSYTIPVLNMKSDDAKRNKDIEEIANTSFQRLLTMKKAAFVNELTSKHSLDELIQMYAEIKYTDPEKRRKYYTRALQEASRPNAQNTTLRVRSNEEAAKKNIATAIHKIIQKNPYQILYSAVGLCGIYHVIESWETLLRGYNLLGKKGGAPGGPRKNDREKDEKTLWVQGHVGFVALCLSLFNLYDAVPPAVRTQRQHTFRKVYMTHKKRTPSR